MTNNNPNIFLSYSWSNKDIADEIDDGFKRLGITLFRDIRDLPYRNSIKEFMNRVSKTDFVLMIMSDEYIKSENCMYEITELINTHEFEKRILPVATENVNHIFTPDGRSSYYDYWLSKINEAEARNKKHLNIDHAAQYKKYRNIYDYLELFFTKIIDLNLTSHAHLKLQNYKPVLHSIGYEIKEVNDEIAAIQEMEDVEEKEMALEDFLQKNPENISGLMLKAKMEFETGSFKKSKRTYIQLLKKHPNSDESHCNLGYLYQFHFSDPAEARKHYETALSLNENHYSACHNLATTLDRDFLEYDDAKRFYERAIQLNPLNDQTYHFLALLLEKQYADYEGAKKHYKKLLRNFPENYVAHYELAILLEEKLSDYEGAKKHFEIALYIQPSHDIRIRLDLLLAKIGESPVEIYKTPQPLSTHSSSSIYSLIGKFWDVSEITGMLIAIAITLIIIFLGLLWPIG